MPAMYTLNRCHKSLVATVQSWASVREAPVKSLSWTVITKASPGNPAATRPVFHLPSPSRLLGVGGLRHPGRGKLNYRCCWLHCFFHHRESALFIPSLSGQNMGIQGASLSDSGSSNCLVQLHWPSGPCILTLNMWAVIIGSCIYVTGFPWRYTMGGVMCQAL